MAAVMLNSRLSMSPPEQMTEEDKFQERKRDILVLVMRFLADYGYLITYQSLCAEASMTLDQVDAADNIDLMTIVQEFVDYYHSKFGRYPKLIRHNFPPPVAYQMPQQISSQQLPQAAMQEMHAMQLQAATAAAAAASVVSSQQQQQQQAQQMANPGGPQTLLPPSLLVSQAPQVLPASVSAAMPTAMDCSMSLGVGNSNNAAACGSTVAGQEATGMQQVAQQQALQQLLQQQQGSLLARGQINCWIPKEKRDRQHTNLANMEGSTKQLGSTEPLDQAGLVAILQKAQPSELPSKYLDFRYPVRPKAVKAGAKAKRPDKLAANDIQEEVMYALVGCTDIGWSSRNLNDKTREFLQQHYSIDRAFTSTFFKNRSQRCKPYNQPYALEGRRPRSTPLSLALGRSGRSSSSSTCSKGSAAGAPANSEQNNQVATGATAAAAAVVIRAAGGLPPPLQVRAGSAAAAAAGSMPCTSGDAAATLRSGMSGNTAAATTAAAAAAMAAAAAAADDSGYGTLDSFGLGSPPSLPGLSSAMSLPGCLDNDNYLRSISSDLDAAADMGLGEGAGGCISPCGFSA